MIHSVLGLRATGEYQEIPESNIVAAKLPTGWYVVIFNRHELKHEPLQRLSSLGEVVHCFVEDHVMFSVASGWKGGKLDWSVTHDSEKGRFHLEVEGPVPSSLAQIRERLTAAQNAEGGEKSEVDYIYDVPAELALSLTGFRHDQDVAGATGPIFQVLERTSARSQSGLARAFRGLFGKKDDAK